MAATKDITFVIPRKVRAAGMWQSLKLLLMRFPMRHFKELEGWKWNGYRLSLGGTSHVALTSFLERHPEIRRVTLYMDHDLAGFVNARKIKTMLHEDKRFRHIRVSVNPPRMGKDYNEKLLLVREQLQTSQHQRRPKEAAVSI